MIQIASLTPRPCWLSGVVIKVTSNSDADHVLCVDTDRTSSFGVLTIVHGATGPDDVVWFDSIEDGIEEVVGRGSEGRHSMKLTNQETGETTIHPDCRPQFLTPMGNGGFWVLRPVPVQADKFVAWDGQPWATEDWSDIARFISESDARGFAAGMGLDVGENVPAACRPAD